MLKNRFDSDTDLHMTIRLTGKELSEYNTRLDEWNKLRYNYINYNFDRVFDDRMKILNSNIAPRMSSSNTTDASEIMELVGKNINRTLANFTIAQLIKGYEQENPIPRLL